MRARPVPSEAHLAAMIVWSNHLFGRKKPSATFDESEGATLDIHSPEDMDPKGSYLIYSETTQAFIGLVRDGAYGFENPSDASRMRLVFYPAAKA